ncbi:MAG TPA: hypothetical protein VK474_09715 [Chthoniobacterales bacterium]|nr:hypothetical protein [Chthoniobacterales bacterium]
MRTATFHSLAFCAIAGASALFLSSCETTAPARVSTRSLPAYEPPLAVSDLQTVRTTAYTHSESDHLQYGARNALGGQLHSAIAKNEPVPAANEWPSIDLRTSDNLTLGLLSREKRGAMAKHRAKTKTSAKKARKSRKVARYRKPQPRIGSAAADWSRWPVGTTFRVLSTGQVYKVDDYGWALAGRNTIDLYMGSRADMNRWGVRHEKIKVTHWGDRQASIALLTARQHYKHCRRMLLQLQGLQEQAAALH